MATTHHNLQTIGGPTVLNMWAIIDGNMVLIERGRSVRVTAGEALTARELVFLDPADARAHDAVNADRPLLGFVVADAASLAQVYVQTDGVVIDPQATPTWNWTPGAPLYPHASTPGTLTETATESFQPAIALAISAAAIWILPAGMREAAGAGGPATELLDGGATPETLTIGEIVDGEVLIRSGSSIVSTPAGGGGDFTVIEDRILGAPSTSETFSGLDGDADGMYFLKVHSIFNVNSTVVGLRFNADTGANYGSQDVRGTSTTAGAQREVAAVRIPLQFSGATASGRSAITTAWISPRSGFARLVTMETCDDVNPTTIITASARIGVWSNTADNLTSITVYSDQTDGLRIGTRITLCKVG